MPAALIAILPQLIALIPTITVGVEQLIAFIQQVRTQAKVTGEWTPEMETAFLDALIATNTDPAYQPDKPA